MTRTDRPTAAPSPVVATPSLPDTGRPLAAAAWMGGALLCFSAMAVAGREVAVELDTFELMLWRSVIGLVIVASVLAATGGLGRVRPRRLGLHLARNIGHFTGQNLWFYAVTAIPLAQVFAYEFTSPIWVALLAPLVLGERLTRARVLAVLLGFAGILVIARPGVGVFGIGQAAALMAAVGFAVSILTTKMLSRSETLGDILFFMTLMQAVMGLLCAGIDGDVALPSATSAPFVAVVAVGGLAAHFCVTSALARAPAGVVSPMEFARLPLIAVVGMLLYGEPLELAVFAGAALVLAGNLINIRAASRR